MICEVCGCTDQRACIDPASNRPCHWLEAGLCSACEFAPIGARPPEPHERETLSPPLVLQVGYDRAGRPVRYRPITHAYAQALER